MALIALAILVVGYFVVKAINEKSNNERQLRIELQQRNEQLEIEKEIERRFPEDSDEAKILHDYVVLRSHVLDRQYDVDSTKDRIKKLIANSANDVNDANSKWLHSLKEKLPEYEKRLERAREALQEKCKEYEKKGYKGLDPRTVPEKYYPLMTSAIWNVAIRDRSLDY